MLRPLHHPIFFSFSSSWFSVRFRSSQWRCFAVAVLHWRLAQNQIRPAQLWPLPDQKHNVIMNFNSDIKRRVRTLNMRSKSIMLKSLNTNTKQHMNTIITMILLNLYVMLHASKLNTTDFNVRPKFKNVPSSVIITCWIRDDVWIN